MNAIKFLFLPLLCSAVAQSAMATPKTISVVQNTAIKYSFFMVDTAKLPTGLLEQQAQNNLIAQLSTDGVTPCWVRGDLNSTGISCGDIRFGNGELYTYNLETNMPPITTQVIEKYYRHATGVNFLVSTTGLGDQFGRIVHIHFNQRMAQFGMYVDAGQVLAPNITGVQFVVNRETTPIQPVPAGPGGAFVGIEDPHGFTDIDVIPVGVTRAFGADQFSVVPMINFQP